MWLYVDHIIMYISNHLCYRLDKFNWIWSRWWNSKNSTTIERTYCSYSYEITFEGYSRYKNGGPYLLQRHLLFRSRIAAETLWCNDFFAKSLSWWYSLVALWSDSFVSYCTNFLKNVFLKCWNYKTNIFFQCWRATWW